MYCYNAIGVLRTFLLLFFICLIGKAYANHDDVYFDIIRRDPSELVKNNKLYLKKANSTEEELSIMFHTAFSYYYLKDIDNAILSLKNLNDALDQTNSIFTKSIIKSKMAMLYYYCNYKYKSAIEFSQSENLIHKIEKENDYYLALSHLFFQKAVVEAAKNEIDYSIYLYKKAEEDYNKVNPYYAKKLPRLGFCIPLNLGNQYIISDGLEEAEHYTRLSLERAKKIGKQGPSLANMGFIHLKKNNQDSALFYFKESLPLLDKNFDYYNTIEVLNNMKSIYLKRNDESNYNYYHNLQLKTAKRLESFENMGIDIKNSISTSRWYFVIPPVLVLALMIFFLKKYIFSSKPVSETVSLPEHISKSKIKNVNISPKYQNEILEKLQASEEKQIYLDPDLSLAKFAFLLESNTQYISEIINKHKKMSFNAYINSLRINYITDKLENCKKYRAYKISILAEESGFVSHSTFTKVFKQIKGCSPSEYIDILKERDNYVKS